MNISGNDFGKLIEKRLPRCCCISQWMGLFYNCNFELKVVLCTVEVKYGKENCEQLWFL